MPNMLFDYQRGIKSFSITYETKNVGLHVFQLHRKVINMYMITAGRDYVCE